MPQVDALKQKNNGNVDVYREICGLPINTYFSGVKMKWLLENAKLNHSDLGFGTIDTWLISKLTQQEHFATDSSNASRTMLMDLHSLEWSEKMLSEFGIKKEWLPKIHKSSASNFGTVKGIKQLEGVAISGVLGD